VKEHARAPPSPSTLCALSAQAIHAAPGQPGREGCSWYPLWQLEEELDPAARTRYQVVEVLHFMCGEMLRQAGRRVSTRSFDTRSKVSIDLAALAIKLAVGASPDDQLNGRATRPPR